MLANKSSRIARAKFGKEQRRGRKGRRRIVFDRCIVICIHRF